MESTPRKTRVLIVDDSAVIRRILSDILSSDPDIDVVGVASDPFIARDKIKLLNPDVLTLDVEMPRMDGLKFLRNLMRLRPMPVVMVSTLTQAGASVTLEALEVGAVDFVAKPNATMSGDIDLYAAEIIDKVKAASQAKVSRLADSAAPPPVIDKASLTPAQVSAHGDQLIAIGASTGGTEAIKYVLERLPPDSPGVVIVQHIPGSFSGPFAQRMNLYSPLHVREAQNGDRILPGCAFIAPGDKHLYVERGPGGYFCRLADGDPVNRHKPSVDVLFHSVARSAGRQAVGVMLTGMGRDGAEGMKAMHEAGAPTIAQDEATSVVWGMPGSAVRIGAVDWVLPLEKIAAKVSALTGERRKIRA